MPRNGTESERTMTSYFASLRERQRRDKTVIFDVRYMLDGKSRTLSFKDVRSADRLIKQIKRIGSDEAIKIIAERDTAGDMPTVSEWADRYIAALSGVEGKTKDHYRLYMRISIGPAIGELPLDTVTPTDVSGWINAQASGTAGRVYAAKTIKNRHGFLSALFESAVEDDLIRKNPCARSRLPESEQREMVFLSVAEYETIVDYLRPNDRLLADLLASSGLRWGEVSALRPTDFDWAAGTVRVARAWKHSNERGWYVGPPKSKRSRRTISLPEGVLSRLRRHATGISPDGWMFTNRSGAPWRHTKFSEDHWKPAVRLANGQGAWPSRPRTNGFWDAAPAGEPIGKWPGLHSLRHSHASWLLEAGVDMLTIQRRLGHESYQTTANTYSHLSPLLLSRPAEAMNRMLPLSV